MSLIIDRSLTALLKVFESVMYNCCYSFLDSCQLLYNDQHGFSGKSFYWLSLIEGDLLYLEGMGKKNESHCSNDGFIEGIWYLGSYYLAD